MGSLESAGEGAHPAPVGGESGGPSSSEVGSGQWVQVERERRRWAKAELGRRVGVSSPAISQYEAGTLRSPALKARLLAILGAPAESGGEAVSDVLEVPKTVGCQASEEVRIGVPGTWDAAIYTAFEPMAFMKGVEATFEVLPGWGTHPLEHLEVGLYHALIHNRFLLSSSWAASRNIRVIMIAPLYTYRGQSIFVSRKYIEDKVLQRPDVTKKDAQILTAYMAQPFDISATSTNIPWLRNTRAQALLLQGARFAYVPGTDLEAALQQLYTSAMNDFQPESDWVKRSEDDECRALAERPGCDESILSRLYNDFKNDRYDIFCGGLAHLWALSKEKVDGESSYLTICDPKELLTPSLNGLVTLEDNNLSTKADALYGTAAAFYAGARLFKRWYRNIPVGLAGHVPDRARNGLNLINVFRFAEQARPLGDADEGNRGLESSPSLDDAIAWARLMCRYVDFFEGPQEANSAAVDQAARTYAETVRRLSNPDTGGE